MCLNKKHSSHADQPYSYDELDMLEGELLHSKAEMRKTTSKLQRKGRESSGHPSHRKPASGDDAAGASRGKGRSKAA
jgi:hypothetical protein